MTNLFDIHQDGKYFDGGYKLAPSIIISILLEKLSNKEFSVFDLRVYSALKALMFRSQWPQKDDVHAILYSSYDKVDVHKSIERITAIKLKGLDVRDSLAKRHTKIPTRVLRYLAKDGNKALFYIVLLGCKQMVKYNHFQFQINGKYIERRFNISQQAISKGIKKLEEDGLIFRVKCTVSQIQRRGIMYSFECNKRKKHLVRYERDFKKNYL